MMDPSCPSVTKPTTKWADTFDPYPINQTDGPLLSRPIYFPQNRPTNEFDVEHFPSELLLRHHLRRGLAGAPLSPRRSAADSAVMWLEIVCGLVVFRVLRELLFSDDDAPPVHCSESEIIFHVAKRIEKELGAKMYVGLRIPDAETGTRKSVDMVAVSRGSAMVVAVKNLSGFVDLDKDGAWVCQKDKRGGTDRLPDPVVEMKQQVSVVEGYLENRGLALPEGYLSGRIVLPNPDCRPARSIEDLPEIICSDKWTNLKPENRSGFSTWIMDAFRGGKSDMKDSVEQQLHFILNSAPKWDRLELKGDKIILGEFLNFKGKQEDMQALVNVRRSKVGQLTIQKSSLFSGFGKSYVILLYADRDYRSEGASAPEWKEIRVRSSTEVLFQPLDSKKPRKVKLSSLVSVSLST